MTPRLNNLFKILKALTSLTQSVLKHSCEGIEQGIRQKSPFYEILMKRRLFLVIYNKRSRV